MPQTMEDERLSVAATPEGEKPKLFGGRLLAGVAAYVVVAVISIPYVLPSLPRTTIAWVLLLIFGPPIYIVGEWIGEKLSESWGERHPVAKLAKALLFVLLGLACIVINALCTVALRR